MGDQGQGIESTLREASPRVLGALVRRYGEFAAAEEAVQDALLAAARQWPDDGLPDDPEAWLHRVASRRMVDYLRSEMARRRREGEVAARAEREVPPPDRAPGGDEDDSLLLLFMCCHPSLTTPSAVALTLRAIGGLTTAEIARAFMVPEATMAQRISRAKRAIRTSEIPFALPGPSEHEARMVAVLHVLYLIFSEGYTTSGGPALTRVDLSDEAIRLTRMLRAAAPDEPEVVGLLALMLLTDARREARTGSEGDLVPLTAQDRRLWDQGRIAEGVALVGEALSRGRPGPYQVQAAIAALHDEAAAPEDTDWPQILALYDVLSSLSDNPMVELNRAVALAMVEGPAAALERLDALEGDDRLRNSHRLPAVRGHLLEMRGERHAAAEAYRRAARLTANLPERDYLMTRAAAVSEGTP